MSSLKSSIFNLQSAILLLLAGTRRAAYLFCCTVLLAGTARATEYFVAETGSDSNGGLSWNDPLLTIGGALAKSTPTIVTVSNGTYDITAEIAISAAITVRGYGYNGTAGGLDNAARTIVQGTGSGNHRIFKIENSGAVLDGVTARKGDRGSVNGEDRNGAGIWLDGGLVTNCIIKENIVSVNYWGEGGGGGYIKNGTIANSLIVSNQACLGGGLRIWGGSVTIDRCQITDNKGWPDYDADGTGGGGINARAGTVYMYSTLIARSTMRTKGSGFYNDGATTYAYNCTIVSNVLNSPNNGGSGIHVPSGGTEFRNCIVYDNPGGKDGNNIVQTGGSVALYETCYTNPTPASQGTITIDASCITAPPLLKDPGTRDYTLQSSSPCIDKGSNYTWIVAGTKDLAGKDRKIDGDNNSTVIADMGAYEFVPPPSVTVTAPTNNAPFPYYASITATATVANVSGSISVEFFTNKVGDAAASAGTDSGAPYEAALGTFAPGTYKIYATVTDDVGSGTSTTNTFTVNALSVTLNQPLDLSEYADVDSVPGTATVANAQGSVTVTFYTNGAAAGTGAGGPPAYGRNLGTFGAGSLQVYAVAADSGAATATSATHNVTISAPALRVNMIWPSGQTFTHDTSIAATSTVQFGTADYTVTFYTNGAAVGSVGPAAGPEFTYTLGQLPAGSYEIYAVVADSASGTDTSLTNTFTVLSAPSVTLDTPTPAQEFALNATIPAVASPGGGNGSYTVYFYTNATLAGTYGVVNAGGDTTSPYSNNLSSSAGGTFYVHAMVTDGNGKTAYSAATNQYIVVPPPAEIFVAPVGTASHTDPYDTWAKAATNIATAIAYANANVSVKNVTVSNGAHNITAELPISQAYTVRGYGYNGTVGGLANAALTIVQRTGSGVHRIFKLSNSGAVLDGLTIQNGYSGGADGRGAGVYMTAGIVSNCVIRGNYQWYDDGEIGGGGVCMENNTSASDCMLVGCRITGNTVESHWGGGVYSRNYGTIRNCLIDNNYAKREGGGVFSRSDPLSIESCTIVANRSDGDNGGGGIWRWDTRKADVRNCIVWGNTAKAGDQNIYSDFQNNWNYTDYNCTTNPVMTYSGFTHNISADPLFVDPANSNYTLQATSPCIDMGDNSVVTWSTDFAGKARKVDGDNNSTVIADMGAYEFVPPLSVTVTAPTNNAPFPYYASITATATVANASGSISVEFFTNKVGDTAASAGTDSGAPYEAALGTFAPGTYKIYATVSAAEGSATSTTNTFTVNALSVTLNQPLNGSEYGSIDSVPGTATVANVQGSATVTFYTNGASAGTGAGGPSVYGRDLGTFEAGSLQVYAVAADSGAATATSATHTVTITEAALRVNMIWPSGQTFTHDTSIAATSTVQFGTGPYTVTFYTNNGVAVGSAGPAAGPEFTYTLGQLPAGSYQIYAVVADSASGSDTSLTNTFTVLSAPSVSLDTPTNAQEFAVNATITASATPSGGNSSYTVYFYTNSTLSGTYGVVNPGGDPSSPYQATLNSSVGGTNYVYARVTDGNGKTAYSAATNQYVVVPPPAEIFVSQVGTASHMDPYNTWAKAATNIATAISYAIANVPYTKYVTVSNGTYNITAELAINQAITVRSYGNGVTGGLANAAATIVRRGAGNIRIFNMANTSAVLDGFTIREGNAEQGGVRLSGGTVSNSLIKFNTMWKGAIGYEGATLARCYIVNCEITDNYDDIDWESSGYCGAGAYLNGGTFTLRNCLIARNTKSAGAGVLVGGGSADVLLENCTIVSNSSVRAESAVWRYGGTCTFKNCVVYNNTSSAGDENIEGTVTATYTCTTNPVVPGTGNITDNPQFVNTGAYNYTLQASSPCIDVGSNDDSWMVGATDLAGAARKQFGGVAGSTGSPIVDMGAYEAPPPPPAGTVILLR